MTAYCLTQYSNGCSLGSFLFPRQQIYGQSCCPSVNATIIRVVDKVQFGNIFRESLFHPVVQWLIDPFVICMLVFFDPGLNWIFACCRAVDEADLILLFLSYECSLFDLSLAKILFRPGSRNAKGCQQYYPLRLTLLRCATLSQLYVLHKTFMVNDSKNVTDL